MPCPATSRPPDRDNPARPSGDALRRAIRARTPFVRILLLLNDPPYGTERSYNGLRLAGSLARRDGVEVRVFLFGDAVGCALADQRVPGGYYHLDRMITAVVERGGEVGCCGSCLDARGMAEAALVEAPTGRTWRRRPTGRCGPTRS